MSSNTYQVAMKDKATETGSTRVLGEAEALQVPEAAAMWEGLSYL